MAKRKRQTTKKQIEKREKEGRGQNHLENYKPWINIQDVASRGLSTRIKGWKTNRVHQFLSKLELSYFYLLEWSKEVIDIREQFPLDLNETKAIAQELGVKHPTDPFTQESIVMTTDFVVTYKRGIGNYDKAVTIKYAKELHKKRVLEKFEIEKIYWKNRSINWAIVTENDINFTTVENVKWFHSYKNKESLPPDITDWNLTKSLFLMLQMLAKEPCFLYQVTQLCDLELNLLKGQSINIFRYLAANHHFNLDITQPLNPRKKVFLITKNSRGGAL